MGYVFRQVYTLLILRQTLQQVDRFFNIVSCEECRVVGYRYQPNHIRYAVIIYFLCWKCVVYSYIDGHGCWNRKRRLPFIVCRTRKANFLFCWFRFPYVYICTVYTENGIIYIIYIYIYRFVYFDIYLYKYICISVHIYLYIYSVVSNGKRKPRRFSLIHLSFAHRANGSYPFADGLAHLWTRVWLVCLLGGAGGVQSDGVEEAGEHHPRRQVQIYFLCLICRKLPPSSILCYWFLH